MKIHLERIEFHIAIGKDENGEQFALELSKLPEGTQGFHVLDMTDGVITIDEVETEKRRCRIRKMLDNLLREANGEAPTVPDAM